MKILTDSGLVVLWKKIKDLYQKTTVTAKQTTTSTADGGLNVMTFTFGDGTSTTLSVQNGSKGSNGAQGAKGEKGDKGDTGLQGAQGERGPVGATGPQGNSGITDASSKALINDVITGGETSYLSAEVGKLGIFTYDCSKGGTVTHASLQDAINSVPITFQKAGLTIIYKSGNAIYRYLLKSSVWSSDPSKWNYSIEDKFIDLTSLTQQGIHDMLSILGIYDDNYNFIVNAGGFYTSAFIYAKAYKSIIVQNSDAQKILGIVFFDEDRKPLSRVTYDGKLQIIDIPTECTYFRISGRSELTDKLSSIKYLKLVPSEQIVPFEAIKQEIGNSAYKVMSQSAITKFIDLTSLTQQGIHDILSILGIYDDNYNFIVNAGGFYTSAFIYAKAYKSIIVQNSDAQKILGIVFFDEDRKPLSRVTYDGKLQIIDIPTECTYFRISGRSELTDKLSSIKYLKLVPSEQIVPSEMIELSFPDRYTGFINLIDDSNPSNPQYVGDNHFLTSEWFDVSKYDAIKIINCDDVQNLVGLDIRDKFLVPVLKYGFPNSLARKGEIDYMFKLPTNSAFMRLSIEADKKSSYKIGLRKRNSDFDYSNSDIYYNCRKVKKKFMWCAIGDSFTAINGGPGNGQGTIEGYDNQLAGYLSKGYMTRVCERIKNLDYLNYGRSGATTEWGPQSDSFPKADIYTIMYGTNDFAADNLKIGSDDDFLKGIDDGKFEKINYRRNIGATIHKIKAIAPNAKIVVMFPSCSSHIGCHRTNRNVYSYNPTYKDGTFTYSQLCEGIKESCHLHGYYFIDFLHDSGITPDNCIQAGYVKIDGKFKKVDSDDILKYVDIGDKLDYSLIQNDCTWMTYDGNHPSNLGFSLYADMIVPVFEKIIKELELSKNSI